MNILHTSDWHLGRRLYGRRRYAEFVAFLDWLLATIEAEGVDVLLVAGDIFDSGLPGGRTQELYYRFLGWVANSCCRHVVIIAGNHDSPSLLAAPKELLAALNVHVVASPDPAEEVLVLRDAQSGPELVVCAVPFLRDQDIREARAGESGTDKEQQLLAGIRDHYARALALAEETAREAGGASVVAMGHLFAAGGSTVEGDGVRELYIGSLARVDADIFPEFLRYVALGHLHGPQRVGGRETVRYSGAPLAMSFAEAWREKSVCLVALADGAATVRQIPVPVTQRLEQIKGDWPAIAARLEALAGENDSVWLEIVYEGEELAADLRERLDAAVAGTRLEILRVQNERVRRRALSPDHAEERLEDLSVEAVFERCLDSHGVTGTERPALLAAYREIAQELADEDALADKKDDAETEAGHAHP